MLTTMLSFNEFLNQSDEFSNEFTSETKKERRKRMNMARAENIKMQQLQKKVDSYKIEEFVDPATDDNMEAIGKSLGLEADYLKDVMDINKEAMATCNLQTEVKKIFRTKRKNLEPLKGKDFRKVAQLFARFIPDEAANIEGEPVPMMSKSEQLLQGIVKNEDLMETVADKVLKERSWIQKIWDGTKWIASKIYEFFQYILSSIRGLAKWALSNKLAAAVIVLVCLIGLCLMYPNPACSMAYQCLYTAYDYTARTLSWLFNFIQSYFGVNTELVWNASKDLLEAQYGDASLDRIKKEKEAMKAACDAAVKAGLIGGISASGAAATTGVGAPAAGVGAVASAIGGAVGFIGCSGISLLGAGALGIVQYKNKELDPLYTTMKSQALVAERAQMASKNVYYIAGLLLFYIARYGLGKKWNKEKYRQAYKEVDKVASLGRNIDKIKAKAQGAFYDKLEETVLGGKSSRKEPLLGTLPVATEVVLVKNYNPTLKF